MLDTETKFITLLTGDATLTATVPAGNISVGPVDTVIEKQNELGFPRINIHMVSETMRTVPLQARDSVYQLDIWSRNNQTEVETIYERVLTLLNYLTYDQNTSHTFWEKMSGSNDQYESEMRIWHRSCSFTVWAM